MKNRKPRYISRLDTDRQKAGWGDWYWIVDTEAAGGERSLEMIPLAQVARRLAELNGG